MLTSSIGRLNHSFPPSLEVSKMIQCVTTAEKPVTRLAYGI